MRWLALWAGLFAVYATTLTVDNPTGRRTTSLEARHLHVARSLAEGDGVPRVPQGVGVGLLAAPAWAVGGRTGVELLLAAIAALGFAYAAALARRLVPEPWATRGVVAVALSPPAIAYATTVMPEVAAGTLLVMAAHFAVRVHEEQRAVDALRAAGLLAALLWLGPKFALTAIPVFAVLIRWARLRARPLVALVAGEIVFGSLVAYVTASDALFGGVTPYAAGSGATGAEDAVDYLERAPRLATLWLDPNEGLLLHAPVVVLAFVGAWLLWRSRRERLAAVVAERATTESTAALALASIAFALGVAAFGAPVLDGPWPAGRYLVVVLGPLAALVAWGLRRVPRSGAVLAAVTAGLSAWHVATGSFA